MKLHFYPTILLGLMVSTVFVTAHARADGLKKSPQKSPRPNILYFYVDDMGWGSIGPNGQSERRAQGLPSVRTPNLDRLAAQGVNFTRGYGCHVCSPARSSQQSGFHQGHTFADRNDPNNAKKAMRADDVLMGDALSRAGYVTGYWGKWGYGGSKDLQNPVIENLQTLPTSHGYQHVLAELHHVRAHTFFQPTLWKSPAPKGALAGEAPGGLVLVPNSMTAYRDTSQYPAQPALQDHPSYPSVAYCDDSYAFAALDFVREQGSNYNVTGQPFFGLLAVQIPHAPFGEIASLPDWDDAYRDDPQFQTLSDQTRQWAAMVTRIDAHFGNLLAVLEDPNCDGDQSDSIVDHTLVIFQSDNGGPRGKNLTELAANAHLRGTKGMIQEGGIRVPLVMRWPAAINERSLLKAGTNSERPIDVTDLLPTFCDLAGVDIPLGVDGVSIAPTLTGAGNQRDRDFLIHEAGNGQSIIRGKYKLIRTKRRLQLYDLDSDPGETHDLAPMNADLVDELERLLLGERVDEPRGFAVTYHHWIGSDNDSAAAAANWSDYRYENAGITYMHDTGAPQLSWVAKMTNESDNAKTAVADSDLSFLALQLGGKRVGPLQAVQTLKLSPKVKVTGRNEIRISDNGSIEMDQSELATLRWIEIEQGGQLKGTGRIDGQVFNHGRLEVSGLSSPRLSIASDFYQMPTGHLVLAFSSNDNPPLLVSGTVHLAGELSLELPRMRSTYPGESFLIVAADRIQGRFGNPEDRVTTADGTEFRIQYLPNQIRLTSIKPKP